MGLGAGGPGGGSAPRLGPAGALEGGFGVSPVQAIRFCSSIKRNASADNTKPMK